MTLILTYILTLIFRFEDLETEIYEELKLRLIVFLGLPAVILLVSIGWLMIDWIGLTKYVFGQLNKGFDSFVPVKPRVAHPQEWGTPELLTITTFPDTALCSCSFSCSCSSGPITSTTITSTTNDMAGSHDYC